MVINIVLPCYNEEAVLVETNHQLLSLTDNWLSNKIVDDFRIIYVDDGSKDRTWEIIESLCNGSQRVRGLKLAHNAGHQYALWAGLMWSVDKCDAVISIDADLQHDIHKMAEMIEAYRNGAEVVYGVRNDRATDSKFKKKTALGFYKMMQKMGVDLIPNHADFRLLGSKALKALSEYPERNLFLRGMVRTLGFKEQIIYFDCLDRVAGESKYTLSKMVNLAIDGITSFSVVPLRIITVIGLACVGISALEIIYILIQYFRGSVIQGWTSLLFSVWFLGGLTLFAIGVLGEYLGKIYKEVKRRPRYIIEKEA